ncbi:MAG: hypothetical protein M3Y27_15110 [Acidobacteriota bacterium]|nr:hypothetical protein [Acidobacteriota bacterium]
MRACSSVTVLARLTVLFAIMPSQGLGQEPASPQAVTIANTASYRLVASLLPGESIGIGVGYPSDEYGFWFKAYGASRTRDYTPTKLPSGGMGTEGGGPAFLAPMF